MPKIYVSWSRHAADKVTSGELQEDLVLNTLFSGEKELDQEPDKYCARKRFRRGTLAVMYRQLFEEYFVITAYWEEP